MIDDHQQVEYSNSNTSDSHSLARAPPTRMKLSQSASSLGNTNPIYEVLMNKSYTHTPNYSGDDNLSSDHQLAALLEPTAIDFMQSLVSATAASSSSSSSSYAPVLLSAAPVLPRLASASASSSYYSSSSSATPFFAAASDSFAHNVSMSIIRAMTAEAADLHSATSSSSSSILMGGGSTAATTTTLTTTSTGSSSTASWLAMGKVQIPLYAVIFLLAVIGNSLVILTLVQNKRMRTITNVFLLNLAISDLFLGVLCMPFTLVGTLKRDFVFGEFMCKILPFLQGECFLVI